MLIDEFKAIFYGKNREKVVHPPSSHLLVPYYYNTTATTTTNVAIREICEWEQRGKHESPEAQ